MVSSTESNEDPLESLFKDTHFETSFDFGFIFTVKL